MKEGSTILVVDSFERAKNAYIKWLQQMRGMRWQHKEYDVFVSGPLKMNNNGFCDHHITVELLMMELTFEHIEESGFSENLQKLGCWTNQTH